MDLVGQFRSAGRTLFSLGLVRGTEGNLSVFDGTTIWITRAGAALNDLSTDALVIGTTAGSFPISG